MEEIIFARSPFWVRVTGSPTRQTTIRLRIWSGDRDSIPTTAFSRSFTLEPVREQVVLDVSDVILHEIPNPTASVASGVWVNISITHTDATISANDFTFNETLFATEGYVNGGVTQSLDITSSGITNNAQSVSRGSVLQVADTYFALENHSKNASTISSSDDSASKISFSTSSGGSLIDFEEPLYRFSPWRLRFLNKFGVLEDVWMAKRSIPSISIKSDKFTRSNFDYGQLSYNTQAHTSQKYNTIGVRRWTLNTGWLPESFNDTIIDIFLSEYHWIIDENDVIYAVNLMKDGETLKLPLNQPVNEYTWHFEEANPINNVIR